MKNIVLILMSALLTIMLGGCTMYTVEKEMGDGIKTTVKIRSTRDLEQPEVHYVRGAVDTEDYAKFDFSAASVDNNTDAFMGMFQGMMGMFMEMMQGMMKVQMGATFPPVPPPTTGVTQ